MAIVTISPSGGNDTAPLQNAINSTASAGNTLQLLVGSYATNPLTIPSNANIQLSAGVTVNANSGYATNANMLNIDGSNITIAGASAATSILQMLKGSSGYQGQMGIAVGKISGATNVTISGISANNSAGDGMYVAQATSLTVNDCTFNNNMRQGTSIIGPVNGVYLNRCNFTNTGGALPSAGIDIEPNLVSQSLQNIVITDCASTNNAGDGVLISLQNLTSASAPVSIHFLRHSCTGNGGGVGTSGGWAGYRGLNNDPSNAGGYVLFENCSATSSAYWGAVGRFWAANGAALIFKNLTVTNPMVKGPEPDYNNSAAVAVARGGGGTVPLGNVHFINCSISSTNGKTINYFDFFDNSGLGPGPINVQFIGGTLSGATTATPSTPGTWNGGSLRGPIH